MENVIKSKREELGYSQSQLSEISGVNFRTLQDYEQGRKPIASVKGEVLHRISTSLGCTIEDLLDEPVDTQASQIARINRYAIMINELLNKNKTKVIHTPFDDVFRTMSINCSKLLIPVINIAFDEHYDSNVSIVNRQNEHINQLGEGNTRKIVSDSSIVVLDDSGNKKTYQVECQSRTDNTIIMRLFEYSTAIAFEDSEIDGNTLNISYPRSALIYLRHNSSTPNVMKINLNTPGGSVSWDVPVIKTQKYTIDDIFEKQLYMFIPYYLLTYEPDYDKINSDSRRISSIKREYEIIFYRLSEAENKGLITSYEYSSIKELSKKICNYLLQSYSRMNKEVISAMGGQVLELEIDKVYKEAIRKGLDEGRRAGLDEGRRVGLDEGRKEGRKEGIKAGQTEAMEYVFLNMIRRGFSKSDALAISEISEARAEELLNEK